MKYVIDILDESCHNCQLSYMNNDSGDFVICPLLGHTVFNAKHQGICPLIPVEEIDIENSDGSHTRGYKEISVALDKEDYEKEFEVWMEGYACTGESAPHQFIGKVKAKNFKEACYKAVKNWCRDESSFQKFYHSDSCSYWGCRCFDNEKDSMMSFG